jgi:hypothetical protein
MQAFGKLGDHERGTLAKQLCVKHAVIEYTLRTQVLPEYITHHVTSGSQTVLWQPVSPGSRQHKQRQQVVQRMNDMYADSIVPGARALLLDFYGWRLDDDDTGMLHMLLRDLPGTSHSKKKSSGDEEDDDDVDDAATKHSTNSSSLEGIASSYIRAMHTAVVVLRREAHPRSILRPLTSAERRVLVSKYDMPEDLLQGQKVEPRFQYSTAGATAEEVTDAWSFLVSRTSGPFFRDLFLSDVYFALRALALARENVTPEASLAAVHKECRRLWASTGNAARAGFDHGLTTVHCLLQNSKNLFEPNAAALLAIQSLWLSKFLDTGTESNIAVAKAYQDATEYLESDFFTRAAHGADFISCKAGMKMGKTERTIEFIRPHYDACRRILFICQRKTMVRSIEARTLDKAVDECDEAPASADEVQCELAKCGMNFECYDTEECKGVISSAEHSFLICEFESLQRLEGTFDYIILDEFRSTAATMVASTNGERIAHHWETLKELCKVAQKCCFWTQTCV